MCCVHKPTDCFRFLSVPSSTSSPFPRFRSGEEDSTFVAASGSYIFPNITQQNSSYASGDGVEYYCTATNSFGTIRSRTVRAFYACELGGRGGGLVGGGGC